MSPAAPALSVVIAAHNAGPYVAETLESLQHQQDAPEFEVILVDDGSTDDTAAIAGAVAAQDTRFRVIAGHAEGVSAARNTGFADIRAPAVLFLDADDLLEPTALARLHATLERSGAGAALGGVRRISETGAPLPGADNRALAPETGTLLPLLRKNFVVNGGALIIRAATLRQIGGYDPGLRYGEDWEFWCRLAEASDFAIVPGEPVLLYRQRGTGANTVMRNAFFARNVPCIDNLAARPSLQARLGPDLRRALRARRIDVFWSNVRTELQFGHKARAVGIGLAGLFVYPDSLLKPQLALRLIRSLGRG